MDIPTLEEIDTIVRDQLSTAVDVNRAITGAYHRLSTAVRDVLDDGGGPNLDWCGFAKWSSHTVGLDLDLNHPGTRSQELADLVGLPDGLRAELARLLGTARQVEDGLVPKSLRAGNAVIFFEMGTAFVLLVERLRGAGDQGPDQDFARRVIDEITHSPRRAPLPPLDASMFEAPDTASLRDALLFYLRAAREPDGARRAEFLLAGSTLFSVYEQGRADRLITIGIYAPVRSELLPLMSVILHGGAEERKQLLLARALEQHPFIVPIERAFGRALTALALVVEVAGGRRVRLGHPERLQPVVVPTLPEVTEILDRLTGPMAGRQPDWVDLPYRLGFIARYFATFQQDAQLQDKPPHVA